MQDYLIDSNVVINYVAEKSDSNVLTKLDVVFDKAFNYSVITIMEVLGFNDNIEVMSKFEELFVGGNRLAMDDMIVSETIKIRKAVRIKLPDAIIAATAIVPQLGIINR